MISYAVKMMYYSMIYIVALGTSSISHTLSTEMFSKHNQPISFEIVLISVLEDHHFILYIIVSEFLTSNI